MTGQKRANPAVPAVANMSLGSPAVGTALDDTVRASIAAGVTYVFPAGNDSVNASAPRSPPPTSPKASRSGPRRSPTRR